MYVAYNHAGVYAGPECPYKGIGCSRSFQLALARGCWPKKVGCARVICLLHSFGYPHAEAYHPSSRHYTPEVSTVAKCAMLACHVHVLPKETCLPSILFSSLKAGTVCTKPRVKPHLIL